MKIFRVRPGEEQRFAKQTEAAMGIQFVRVNIGHGMRVSVLMSDSVIIYLADGERMRPFLGDIWFDPLTASESIEKGWTNWYERLKVLDAEPVSDTDESAHTELLSYIVGTRGPLPLPPSAPTSIYGHLPFQTHAHPQTVIYRWEVSPFSWRVDRKNNRVAKGTYAAPASEAPFVPTGFAAVGRYALPSLLPQCFRYEIQPDPGYSLYCGASVPLFGQAGGGVEIFFPQDTPNRGAIADPIVIPAL